MNLTPSRLRVLGLSGLLVGSGILHFTSPRGFVAIVPKLLPHKELLVAVSGAAELGCAAMMMVPATRRWGGLATAALFVAVFPANVSMALRSSSKPARFRTIAWARLPLQIPLVVWALQVARPKP